jgi:hypothetical protein
MGLCYMRVVLRCRLAALVIVTGLTIAVPQSAEPAECIENSLWGCVDIWYGFTTLPGAALVWASPTGIEPWTAGQPCELGCYDLRQGLVEVNAWGDLYSMNCGAEIFTGDRFKIMGISGSDPISFRAEFWVDGMVNPPDVDVRAVLREPSDPTGAREQVTEGPVELRMSIPLWHAPGEEFALYASLSAGAAGTTGDAHATGVLRFSGLPQGAYVVSCQGYDLPVPTLQSSWGQIKALYR